LYTFNAVLAIIYYTLIHLLASDVPSLRHLFKSFLFGETVVPYGWYLQSIILIYLLFYVVARLVEKFVVRHKNRALCFGMTVAILLYIVLCIILQLGTTWYETSFAFIAGMLIAANKEYVNDFVARKRNAIVALFIFLIVFSVSFVIGNTSIAQDNFRIASKMLSSVMFALCWIPILRLLTLVNSITTFLSKHYLEIYVFQGAAFLFISNKYLTIQNKYMDFALSLLLTIILAFIAKPIVVAFMTWCKSLVNCGTKCV
jgi:probable poly-beta-1,6-N-acetyl-D-glucosamine export protein